MTDNSSSNKRIARNSLFLSLRMVFVMCVSLYTSRVVLQNLGVEDYGVYNVVCGFVTMFSFLNTSMSNGIQRYFNFELGRNGSEGANRVYFSSLIIQLVLGIVLTILIESIGLWYLHNKMVIPEGRMFAAEWVFQFAILGLILIIMQVPYTAAVMAHERMDFFALVSILDAVMRLVLILLLPYINYDKLILYGIITLLINVTNFTLFFVYCKKRFVEIRILKNKKYSDKSLLGSMLSFSGWNVFGSFSNMMRDQGINLILNFFYGPVVNAARGIANQVNSAISNLVSSILTPVRPQVIQSYARNEIDRTMKLTFTISKFSLYFLILMIIPVCIEIDSILHLWLGDVIPDHTQAFCLIVLATSAILIPMGALATLVHASGKMVKYQLIGGTVKLLSVPIAYFMMKRGFAPEWALIAVLIFDGVGFIVGMFIIKTLMPFSIAAYLRFVLAPLIPVIILSFIAEYSMHLFLVNAIVRFLTIIILGSSISLLSFYTIATTKDERILIHSLINSFINSIVQH